MNWIFQIGAPNSKAASLTHAYARATVENGWRIRQHIDSLPIRPGTTPLKVVPEYESWLVEALGSGPESPFWHIKGMSVIDHVNDYADVLCCIDRLVRLLDAAGHDELRSAFQGQEVATAAGDRPVGSRRPKRERGRRSRVHAKTPGSTFWHSG